MNHVDANDAVSRSDRPRWLRGVQDNRRAHIRDLCGLHPCGDTQQGFRFRIGRLESETREISRKMNDVLTRAACDFEDDTRHRQDVAKDIEDEIAIAYCRGRVLAMINLALASLTARLMLIAEISRNYVRVAHEISPPCHRCTHCPNYATSQDVTTTPTLIA